MVVRSFGVLALLALPAVAQAQTADLPPPPPGAAGAPAQPPVTQPSATVYAQPAPVYAQPGYPQPVYGDPSQGAYAPYSPPRFVRRRVVDYHGGPIPPGAVLETQRPYGLLVGGGAAFLGAYLTSILTVAGNDCSACGDDWLYVPLVGPWVSLGYGGHAASDNVFLVLDGVAQAAGVAMFGAGLALSRQVLVFTEFAPREHPLQWSVIPMGPAGTAGATLSIVNF